MYRLKFNLLETQAGQDIYNIGKKERSQEIAKRMLLKDIPISKIAEVTNFSEQEIIALKATL